MGTPFPLGLFLLLSLLSWNSQAAVVTVSPQSVTVGPFEIATFTCEGTGNTSHWLVQAAPLTPTVQQERDITFTDPGGPGNLSSILTVPALPINDGIGIGCYILSNSNIPAFSNSATLTIRGVSPVEDLQFNFTSNNSLLITWSSPVYYSNDIPADSTVSYNVILTNKTGNILVDTNTTNTLIEVDNITECDTFDVSVTALKGQYVSINNTNGSNGSLNNAVPIEKNTQNFLKPSVTFNLNCPPSKSWIILTVTSDDEVIDQHVFNGSDKKVFYTRELLPSKEYNYTITVMNLRNISEHENYTIITTYQVSDLNITNQYTNGSVNVQCVFVSGSTADGCHVIFTDTTNGRNESFNITLPEESKQVSLSTSGIYTVTAYDIYNGSVFGPAVRHSTPVSVVIPTLSPSSTSLVIDTSSTSFSEYSSSNSVITTSPTVPVETATVASSPTTGSVLYLIAGVVVIIVVLMIVISIVMMLLVVIKRVAKKRNRGIINSGPAACHQPQADTNPYELVAGVSSDESSEAAPPNGEDPYYVTPDVISAIRNARPVQQDYSPATTIPLVEIQYHNNLGASDNHEACPIPPTDHNSSNSAAYAIVTINNNDTTAPVNPPTGVQSVMYSKVAGDITKRGAITVYPCDDSGPPPSYDDVVKQETSEITSSQCLTAAPTLVTGVPLVQEKNILQADIESENDYNITVFFAVEDDDSLRIGEPSKTSANDGDTHTCKSDKEGYSDDHIREVKEKQEEDFTPSVSQEESSQPTFSHCVLNSS